MGKNVLIVSTSPRVGSNSDLLANEFGRGAKDEIIRLEELEQVGKEIEKTSEKQKPATQSMFRAI